jgi:hypothetical protein
VQILEGEHDCLRPRGRQDPCRHRRHLSAAQFLWREFRDAILRQGDIGQGRDPRGKLRRAIAGASGVDFDKRALDRERSAHRALGAVLLRVRICLRKATTTASSSVVKRDTLTLISSSKKMRPPASIARFGMNLRLRLDPPPVRYYDTTREGLSMEQLRKAGRIAHIRRERLMSRIDVYRTFPIAPVGTAVGETGHPRRGPAT